MLNVGNVEGMEQEMSGKSAFMELQQSGMGMGHPAYPMRSSYQPHHHGGQHGDSVFSTPQGRGPLAGYPFHMNAMSPTSYNPPTGHHFSMPPYQSPSPTRDGKYPCWCNCCSTCNSVFSLLDFATQDSWLAMLTKTGTFVLYRLVLCSNRGI